MFHNGGPLHFVVFDSILTYFLREIQPYVVFSIFFVYFVNHNFKVVIEFEIFEFQRQAAPRNGYPKEGGIFASGQFIFDDKYSLLVVASLNRKLIHMLQGEGVGLVDFVAVDVAVAEYSDGAFFGTEHPVALDFDLDFSNVGAGPQSQLQEWLEL